MSIERQSLIRKRGPRFKLSRLQAREAQLAYENSSSTVDEIARGMGVTKQTIYNVMRRLRDEAGGVRTEGWK